MARPKNPRSVLSGVIGRLEAELADPTTSPARRRSIDRQLILACSTLVQIEKQAAKVTAPAPTSPPPAQASAPVSDETDKTLARMTARFRAWKAAQPVSEVSQAPTSPAPAPDYQRPGAAAPTMQEAQTGATGGDLTAPDTSPAVREADGPQPMPEGGPAPNANPQPADAMPRLLWLSTTVVNDAADVARFNNLFRLACGRGPIADSAATQLKAASDAAPPDTYQFRLYLLLVWVKRHPEFDSATIHLPDEISKNSSIFDCLPESLRFARRRVINVTARPADREDGGYRIYDGLPRGY